MKHRKKGYEYFFFCPTFFLIVTNNRSSNLYCPLESHKPRCYGVYCFIKQWEARPGSRHQWWHWHLMQPPGPASCQPGLPSLTDNKPECEGGAGASLPCPQSRNTGTHGETCRGWSLVKRFACGCCISFSLFLQSWFHTNKKHLIKLALIEKKR